MPTEVWKDMPNFNGFYLVSDLGRVQSLPRSKFSKAKSIQHVPGGILKIRIRRDYPTVYLSRNGHGMNMRVHRAVALAFIPNPEGKPCVNHKDGNKNNCRADNLEWVTYKENDRHASENGLKACGSRQHLAKMSEEDVSFIKKQLRQGQSVRSLARTYQVHYSTMLDIKHGKTWRHVQ